MDCAQERMHFYGCKSKRLADILVRICDYSADCLGLEARSYTFLFSFYRLSTWQYIGPWREAAVEVRREKELAVLPEDAESQDDAL